MFRKILSALAALAFSASAAFPQVGAGVSNPGGQPTATFGAFGGTPAISGCGTGAPVMSGGSNSVSGTITEGTTTTGCTITWTNNAGVATPRVGIPVCIVTARAAALTTYFLTGSGLTGLQVTNGSATGLQVDYLCIGS